MSEPVDPFDAGCIALDEERWADAAQLFQQALELDPGLEGGVRDHGPRSRHRPDAIDRVQQEAPRELRRLRGTQRRAEARLHRARARRLRHHRQSHRLLDPPHGVIMPRAPAVRRDGCSTSGGGARRARLVD